MATLRERYEMTLQFVSDEDVTIPEAIAQIYVWARYERAIRIRNRAIAQLEKFEKKLNENIDVVNFRKQLKDV